MPTCHVHPTALSRGLLWLHDFRRQSPYPADPGQERLVIASAIPGSDLSAAGYYNALMESVLGTAVVDTPDKMLSNSIYSGHTLYVRDRGLVPDYGVTFNDRPWSGRPPFTINTNGTARWIAIVDDYLDIVLLVIRIPDTPVNAGQFVRMKEWMYFNSRVDFETLRVHPYFLLFGLHLFLTKDRFKDRLNNFPATRQDRWVLLNALPASCPTPDVTSCSLALDCVPLTQTAAVDEHFALVNSGTSVEMTATPPEMTGLATGTANWLMCYEWQLVGETMEARQPMLLFPIQPTPVTIGQPVTPPAVKIRIVPRV